MRLAVWIVSLAGLFLALGAGGRSASEAAPAQPVTPTGIRVSARSRFLWGKLVLWLPALLLAALLGGALLLVPLPLPVFNLIYVGFIGGYGLLMAVLYWRGWMPGTEGRLHFRRRRLENESEKTRRPLLVLLMAGVALSVTALYARSGWFWAPPLGDRLIWLLLFTPPTALGFWIGGHEWHLVGEAAAGQSSLRAWLTLVGLLPFILWTAFQAALGSLSGMVAGVQGLVILAFVLAFGGLVLRFAARLWVVALLQAVLLYCLVLPQGVLFSF
jgi:hypothetical protein